MVNVSREIEKQTEILADKYDIEGGSLVEPLYDHWYYLHKFVDR